MIINEFCMVYIVSCHYGKIGTIESYRGSFVSVLPFTENKLRPNLTADILTCHSRKGKGVTNNIKAGLVVFGEPACTIQEP